MQRLSVVALVLSFLYPSVLYAAQVQCTNAYTIPARTITYELPQGTENPGPNQHGTLVTNTAGAQADKGRTFFTRELTSFNDAQCTGGPCRNNIPGIAHRTWPQNSCVEVCSANGNSSRCVLTLVMDKGPNTQLGCRTIDANPALQAALQMGSNGTIAATYKLVHLPGEGECNTGTFVEPGLSVTPGSPTSQSLFYASGGTQGMLTNPYNQPFTLNGYSPTSGLYSGSPGGASPFMGGGSSPYLSGGGSGMSVYTTQPSASYGATSVPGPGGSSNPNQQIPSVPQSAAKIIVQPNSVRAGQRMYVSWTAVGMQPNSCTVRKNGASFSTGSEGSLLDTASEAGTMTYSLSCSKLSGGVAESSASISIQ